VYRPCSPPTFPQGPISTSPAGQTAFPLPFLSPSSPKDLTTCDRCRGNVSEFVSTSLRCSHDRASANLVLPPFLPPDFPLPYANSTWRPAVPQVPCFFVQYCVHDFIKAPIEIEPLPPFVPSFPSLPFSPHPDMHLCVRRSHPHSTWAVHVLTKRAPVSSLCPSFAPQKVVPWPAALCFPNQAGTDDSERFFPPPIPLLVVQSQVRAVLESFESRPINFFLPMSFPLFWSHDLSMATPACSGIPTFGLPLIPSFAFPFLTFPAMSPLSFPSTLPFRSILL